MNLIDAFQNLVAQVPEWLQPVIVALAGTVPFIEGEGASAIGIVGGIPPVIAAVAAIIGNFVCVAALVLLGSGARAMVDRTRQRQSAAVGAAGQSQAAPGHASAGDPADRGNVRRAKFARAFERYGVPGVSLLGPLLLPTQFTATMLAASGVGKARILLWQAIAIIAWTTVTTLIITGVISVIR